MPRQLTGNDVFSAAYERLRVLYEAGHRVVVTFSGGKDSTVVLELAIMVARDVGRLPVDVCIQDEELAYPGTYEFVERTAQRPEVRMSWLVMRQPMVNIFNRADPYWWIMDPQLQPSQWMREPPSYCEWTEDKAIESMVNGYRFPVEDTTEQRWDWDTHHKTQKLIKTIGLRVQESYKRNLGIHSTGGYMTRKTNEMGVFAARPIYDWSDTDVWKFLKDIKADYNRAYDMMYRAGVPAGQLRIGPPTMSLAGITCLQYAARAWPQWFDKACTRIEGLRTAVKFGAIACRANRYMGETWKDVYERECLGPDTPPWIVERAQKVRDGVLSTHGKHSTSEFPESSACPLCGMLNSWRTLCRIMWNGDPYRLYTGQHIPMCEPEFFRPGAGTWGGHLAGLTGKKMTMSW